jgi:hypothetical protein
LLRVSRKRPCEPAPVVPDRLYTVSLDNDMDRRYNTAPEFYLSWSTPDPCVRRVPRDWVSGAVRRDVGGRLLRVSRKRPREPAPVIPDGLYTVPLDNDMDRGSAASEFYSDWDTPDPCVRRVPRDWVSGAVRRDIGGRLLRVSRKRPREPAPVIPDRLHTVSLDNDMDRGSAAPEFYSAGDTPDPCVQYVPRDWVSGAVRRDIRGRLLRMPRKRSREPAPIVSDRLHAVPFD